MIEVNVDLSEIMLEVNEGGQGEVNVGKCSRKLRVY